MSHELWDEPGNATGSNPVRVLLAASLVLLLVAGAVTAFLANRDDEATSEPGGGSAAVSGAQAEITEVIPPDAIPSIDDPVFVAASEVDFIADREPVISVEVGGETRAYPLQILTWHEIVNDTIAGTPIAVTFCPLCNTAVAFVRPEIDGKVTTFGTSGKLINSNLLMYDRQSESLWPQATGVAIQGSEEGRELERIPAQIVSWAEFRTSFPGSKVLSRDTGFDRDYGTNPYPGYDDVDSQPFLFSGEVDGRLAPVERVLGVKIKDELVAYPYFKLLEKALEEATVVNDEVGGEPVVVMWRSGTASALDKADISGSRDVGAAAAFSRRLDGRILTFEVREGAIMDTQTGSTWDIFGKAREGELEGSSLEAVETLDSFWFDWAAFHPETQIWDVNES